MIKVEIQKFDFNTEDVRLVITGSYGRQELRMNGANARCIVEAVKFANGLDDTTPQDGVEGLKPYEFTVLGKSIRWYLKRDVDALLGKRQMPALPPEWEECERIRDLNDVDDAFIGFKEDPTGDNATCVVRAILTAFQAGGGK